VAEVEVGLGAVFGHEDFPMLEGAHRAGVDVDVGIELEVGNLDSAGFENRPEGGGGDALAQEDTTPPVTKTYLVMTRGLLERGMIADPPPLFNGRAQQSCPLRARYRAPHRNRLR
jgi:hypothetical protein